MSVYLYTNSIITCRNVIFLLFYSILASASQSSLSFPNQYQRPSRQSSCARSQYTCANKECISLYNVCDGLKDCSDGSDETKDLCGNIRCPTQAFTCSYGACIDNGKQCNNKVDCADGSDEQGCSTNNESNSTSNCKESEFQCYSGKCIANYDMCDGVKNCDDGSDETKEHCSNLKCPSNSFQCDYGACLEQTVKCNGSNDCPDGSDEWACGVVLTTTGTPNENRPTVDDSCRLPEHPKHGVYVSSLCQPGDVRPACRNLPGLNVPSNWLLKYSCNANYFLTSSDSEYSVCDNGVWKNSIDCIKVCPVLKSLSVDLTCVYNGRDVSCNKPVRPGTTATAKCKQHYKAIYKPNYSSLLCLDTGEWSYPLFHCEPECGISTKSDTLTPLILQGEPSHQGEYPWLAALYLKNASSSWEQKCAGTLITPHIVLTAAHCLVLSDGAVIDPQNIKVGLGKYHRDFYKYENFSVIADIKEVVIPRYYSGGSSFYALDIGLLDLVVSVQVSAYIMPACVDWISTITVTSGNIGHVAGWGTTENRISSETVMSAELTYIDNAACIKRVRQAYKRFVTHDKFCAGSINGSQVDKGDSGGGLTVVRDGQHFLIGIVSTKIQAESSFSLFTDLKNAEHHSWLEEHRTRLDGQHFET